MRGSNCTLKIKKLVLTSAIGLLFCGFNAHAGNILYHIDSPEEGGAYFGISNLRGWAVSDAGIDRVEVYLDGKKFDVPMGASRGDVGSAYPNYPESSNSGFAMAYNYGLKTGPVTVTYKIYDNDGAVKTEVRNVTAIKFSDIAYLNESATVDYSAATFTTSGDQIQITGMKVNGVSYNATLAWNTESQQLQFTSIN